MCNNTVNFGFIDDSSSTWASHVAIVVMNPPANAGDIRDVVLVPGLGRFPGEGHGDPLQYSCLGNPKVEETGGLQYRVSQRDLALTLLLEKLE